MVELGEQVDGVYGTPDDWRWIWRFTITLIKDESVEAFQKSVSEGYEGVTGRKPEIYVCSAADGVGKVT